MILFKSIFAGISAASFGIYFNSPKKSILGNLLGGTIGVLMSYIILNTLSSKFLSLTLSAFIIGTWAELFAKFKKLPSTVFLVPCLIPLVPGMAMFKTMQGLASPGLSDAIVNGIDAVASSTALALGVILSSLFSSSINRARKVALRIEGTNHENK